MSRIISEVLNAILAEGRFTAKELGALVDVSANMIYKAKNDEAELSMNKIARISRYLADQGELRLARCFLSYDHEIVPRQEANANGIVDDEVADMVEALGQARQCHKAGDRTGLTNQIVAAERALQNLRAERDRL